jgi:hypothetical protein
LHAIPGFHPGATRRPISRRTDGGSGPSRQVLLGLMDLKGLRQPFFFKLEREP